ncbi:uncharacterized protein TRIADDRAFT_53450 [Trichoplax adhaerens]|uniref:Protein transport protein sec16 n=1 Tax=Trichoplax adhaerens TaxID=10228 RepID=B3RP94_TRIAD|nr:hypothetical protein TRIADDRAFT_53450 [Trichoplax adhaerens]EDV28150.1 hypothetical protein TRIADDRAFT_53450 [Trichoplax adhaerens]|eukprot:XP_002109984.1 hypothetical protein TRIADDRAFT_53450 [Trichoplax adhaerens]
MDNPGTRNAAVADFDDNADISHQSKITDEPSQAFDSFPYSENVAGLDQEKYEKDSPREDEVVAAHSESELDTDVIIGGTEGTDVGGDESEYHWLDDYGDNSASKTNQDLPSENTFQLNQETDVADNPLPSDTEVEDTVHLTDERDIPQDGQINSHFPYSDLDTRDELRASEKVSPTDARPEGNDFAEDNSSANPQVLASFSYDPEFLQGGMDENTLTTSFSKSDDINIDNDSSLDNKLRSSSHDNLSHLGALAYGTNQRNLPIRQNKSSDNLSNMPYSKATVVSTGSEPSLVAAVRAGEPKINYYTPAYDQGAAESTNVDKVETDNFSFAKRTDSFVNAIESKDTNVPRSSDITPSITQEESKIGNAPIDPSDNSENPLINSSSNYQVAPVMPQSQPPPPPNNFATSYLPTTKNQPQFPGPDHFAKQASVTKSNQYQGMTSAGQPYVDQNQTIGNESSSAYGSQYQQQQQQQPARLNTQSGNVDANQYYNYQQQYPYASYPYQQYYYYPTPWDPYGYQYQQYQDWYYSTYYQNANYYGSNPNDQQNYPGFADHQQQEAQYYENYYTQSAVQQGPQESNNPNFANNAQGDALDSSTYDSEMAPTTSTSVATPQLPIYDHDLTSDNNVTHIESNTDNFHYQQGEPTIPDYSEVDASAIAYPPGPDEDVPIEEDEEDQKPPPLYVAPHVRCNFSFGGVVVMTSASNPNMVTISQLQNSVSEQKLQHDIKDFPGPLMCDDTHKRDIISYIETKIANTTDRMETSSSRLLWKYLLMGIRQNGTILNTDISELLLNDEQLCNESSNKLATNDDFESECHDEAELESSPQVSFNMQAIEKEFRQLLLQGKKREALEIAIGNGLWGHAMILSNRLDSRMYKMVINKFFLSMMEGDTLLTLYQVLDGQLPTAITNKRTINTNWKSHLAMLLSNTTSNSKFDKDNIISLGNQLMQNGDIFAGQLCYLIAGVIPGRFDSEKKDFILVGQNSASKSLQYLDIVDIHRTEICEYIRSLQRPGDAFPKFQPYKFMYAALLSELGGKDEALQYLESLAYTIHSNPKLYSKSFIKCVANFASRATYFNPEDSGNEDEDEPEWLANLHSLTDLDYNNNLYRFNNSTSTDNNDVIAPKVEDDYTYQNPASPIQSYSGGGNLSLVHTPAESNKSVHQFTFDESEINRQHENKPGLYTPTQSENNSGLYNRAQPENKPGLYSPTIPTSHQRQDSPKLFYNPNSTSQSQPTGGNIPLNPIYEPAGNSAAMYEPASSKTTVPRANTYKPEENQQGPNIVDKFQPNRDTVKAPSDDMAKKSQDSPAKTPGRKVKQKGWLSTVSSMIFRGKNEMHLPDDRKPTIYYDENLKKWVDNDNPEETTKAAAPPPSDTQLTKPSTAQPSGRSQYVDVFGGKKSETTSGQKTILPPNFLNPVQNNTTPAKATGQFFVPTANQDDVSDPFTSSSNNNNSNEGLQEHSDNDHGRYQTAEMRSNRENRQQAMNRQEPYESNVHGNQNRNIAQDPSGQLYDSSQQGVDVTAHTGTHDSYAQGRLGGYAAANMSTSQPFSSNLPDMQNRYSHDLTSSYGTESNVSDLGFSASDTGVSDSVQSTPRQSEYQNETNTKPQDIYQQPFPIGFQNQGGSHSRTSSFNRQKRPPLSLGGAYY